MSNTGSDLYRWERLTKPRVYSRSQRVTTEDDIQDWIKKVEVASDRAASAAFGMDHGAGCNRGCNPARAVVEDVHIHDAAYAEAQDLLEQWVSNKVNLDDMGVEDSQNWDPPPRHLPSDIKREWDHLLEDNGLELAEDIVSSRYQHNKHGEDPYSVYEKEADETVENFVQAMLEKDILSSDFVADIHHDDKPRTKDPTTKMALRHQQVKDRRQRREKELTRQREMQQMKKEAEFEARQIVKKEEEAKQRKKQKEEEAIQSEMAKLRKQMVEDRKRKDEEERMQRERKLSLEKTYATPDEDGVDWHSRLTDELHSQRLTEKRRRHAQYQQHWIETRIVTHRLKLLQKCFSAWYSLIVERRLQAGRARAMGDWHTLLRAWNAWRAYTRSRHMERDTRHQQQQIREMTRKEHMAQRHYGNQLLRQCMAAWQLYVTQTHQQREIQEQRCNTHAKMAAFLGKLCDKDEEQKDQDEDSDVEQIPQDASQPSKSAPGSARSNLSDNGKPVSVSARSTRSKTPGKPTDAWLITRKHIDQIKVDKPGKTNAEADTSGTTGKKAPFVVNNMEHRHKAQQKILATQQNQIQEQQRLIEELQFLQRQQLLQQQLMQNQGQTVPNTTQQNQPVTANHSQLRNKEAKEETDSGGDITERSVSTAVPLSNRSDTSHASVSTVSTTVSKASKLSSKVDTRHGKFVKSMAARAEERARLKAEREERRRELEEARLLQLQKEAEEAALRDEEEKRRRAAEIKERKQLERQRQEERQRQQEVLREQTLQAAEHHRLGVLRYRGWIPWRHLMAIAADKKQRAEMHYRNTLLRQVLVAWNSTVRKELANKYAQADELHNFLLVRHCLTCWSKVKEVADIQEAKAVQFHSKRLLSRILIAWQDFAQEEKMIGWRNERLAREHNIRRIQLRAFEAWRRYPKVLQDEEAKEKRLTEMRKKVSSLIPDFSVS